MMVVTDTIFGKNPYRVKDRYTVYVRYGEFLRTHLVQCTNLKVCIDQFLTTVQMSVLMDRYLLRDL